MQLKTVKPESRVAATHASTPTQTSGETDTSARLMSDGLIQLQQTHGNRFVQRMLRRALIQRKCACSDKGGKCDSCRDERRLIQAKFEQQSAPFSVPAVVNDVPRSFGNPLDQTTRTFMEARFKNDLSGVRVHTDTQSGEMARTLGAYAYTVGQDIYFAPGLYNPESADGRRLLAHELAHTIQQKGAIVSVQRQAVVDYPNSPLEHEADRAAEAVISGITPRISGNLQTVRPQMQRVGGERLVRTRRLPGQPGTSIEVTRTVEQRPCTRERRPESTPAGDVLFFDQEAAAFGIRYRYCTGGTRIELETAGRYGQLRDKALELYQNLATATGADLLQQIREAAQQVRLGADTSIVLTVSGVLRAEVRGSTQQGLPNTGREYQVEGLLRLTPRGWRLEIGGRFRHVSDELSRTEVTSVEFTPRVEVGRVQVSAGVERTEQQTSGAASRTTTVRGSVSVRTGDRTGLTLSGSTADGGSFFITFGTVESIPGSEQFDCAICRCPPPLPRYTCNTIVEEHPGPPLQTAGHEVVEFHYNYDNDVPQDNAVFEQQRDRVVELMRQRYRVVSIRGYASPETNVAYNLALAQRRANHALREISAAIGRAGNIPNPSLPAAEGTGELLGEGTAASETRDRDLIRVLSDRLGAVSEDERLTLLGLDPRTITPAEREDALRRIEAFRTGRDQGRSLNRRARWERIFPFLRRVDVTLDRPRIEGPPIPRTSTRTNCDADTLNWARVNFPRLRDEEVRPTLLGMC